MIARLHWLTAALLLGMTAPLAHSADPPAVRELRVQKVGDAYYFHVRLQSPKGMQTQAAPRPVRGLGLRPWVEETPQPEPRLVPQDGQVRATYRRLDSGAPRGPREVPPIVDFEDRGTPDGQPPPNPQASRLRQPVPVDGLEFVGKASSKGEVKLVLLYPRDRGESRAGRILSRLGRSEAGTPTWTEAAIALDLRKAKEIAIPAEAKERTDKPDPKKPRQPPVRDDLEGLWAAAQVDHLNQLAVRAGDFGFYSFAATATARKYGLAGVDILGGPDADPGGARGETRVGSLYETTTGAAAIAESLALRRMAGTGRVENGKRTVDIAKIEGIDVAEHPWKKMIGDKKPAPEPLAALVPHDNYYVHFQSIRKFIEFGELLDQWGTTVVRAVELNSRDYRLKERYDRQLCLRSTGLGKTLGPLVIKGVAITGSDAYLREGSDVTVVFHINDRKLFTAVVDGFLKEARQKHGADLKESKSSHRDVAVESFVTPLREVSLHRAFFDDFAVYANSSAGLHRVIDVHKGKAKRLADSLDFQYMRTIFRADDKAEDGFVFLSDAFIRQLGAARK